MSDHTSTNPPDNNPTDRLPSEPRPSKIRHPDTGFKSVGSGGSAKPEAMRQTEIGIDETVAMAPARTDADGKKREIRAFGGMKRHEDNWQRTPNTTGVGAIHVKSFHGKITDDGLRYMDQQINEWLDAHPQYEVKFVNSTIGTFTGKIKEPQLICQVWV